MRLGYVSGVRPVQIHVTLTLDVKKWESEVTCIHSGVGWGGLYPAANFLSIPVVLQTSILKAHFRLVHYNQGCSTSLVLLMAPSNWL
jgi:hypothetical protein